ncbi:Histidine-binding periplasmic protein [Andreprevotia sp. IGB-42]|uniref:substrate-binding periplasmic protein n=1 Tax=Andreprevotia sp. IGB-42 TaxID=2497473 RepID=UPI001359A53F|nr:transporter substrate-binding domain-containing protein [Andreprevotia sp. IGB-42]KAF0813859.1 Histidine-binding periplasmic protein [Andreprevotia sp. IGB-42]
MRIAALALAACCSWALAHTASAQTIHLVTGNYPPYEYEEDGKVVGLAVDILKEAFARSQWQVEIRVVPWARALREAQQGDADAVFSTLKTPEREQAYLFSQESLVPFTSSFFVPANSTIRFDGKLVPLLQYRFGALNEASNGKMFDSAVKSGEIANIEMANDTLTNIRKLMAGRIDIMVSNTYSGVHFLKKNQLTGRARALQPYIDSNPAYIAFTRKRDMRKARQAFDSGLAAMKRDGSYQRIMDRYAR